VLQTEKEAAWTDHVRNETLHTVKKARNILRTIKQKNVNWIVHILRRNRLLKHLIEDKIQGCEEEEEDVSSYWMTLRKRNDTVI
jgi:hypothetical protein